jgi:poly(hydroxyalkanoate) granule-associated protein
MLATTGAAHVDAAQRSTTKRESVMQKSKLQNKVVKSVKADANLARTAARDLWLAGIGAVAVARKQGEKIYANLKSEGTILNKKTSKLVDGKVGDVKEQIEGVLAKIKDVANNNLARVSETAEETVGTVLNRLGMPSKLEVRELSKRVADLSKQVKTLQAKRAA